MHVAGAGGGEPGVVEVRGDALLVGCGDAGLIGLDEVQLEGKRRMSAAEFLRGNQVTTGERLGYD
jgi:methionyl-tRNA formyltransferase